ncbi:hypothetical protein PR202_ga14783 [Eleusine coracana subsp. coracana]|uniref:Uncharacterized protein n=1 Tax=Eleusine coracana subsp. coracana TaxID=191504 RepID=A0AAV5CI90_ELECO|nr:hypothetical protein QOZ80_6BG0500160 [Eleusine coracana subsp. coracana]GJM97827.1 hypothetical protein PR202_ga14783 [Eleusine coracana subsp. coracana]
MAAAACRRAVSYTLLGPPAESLRAAAARAVAAAPTTGDAFLDLMDANFNKPTKPPPAKTLTENSSPTFVSSGDPCLDFFFHVVPGTPATSVASLIADAWAAEPITALRLVCNLRGVRGTGKSDREGFYAAALWMHGCHPTTLALNARPVSEFGYLKDFPEILHRIIHGGVSTRTPGKKARLAASGGIVARFRGGRGRGRFVNTRKKRSPRGQRNGLRDPATREARVAAANERDQKASADAAIERRKRRADAASRAVERYSRDATYRFLHDRTADLFADLLAEDMKKLEEGKIGLSLAAKWCPSLESCYDRSTLLCEAIARRLFPKCSAPELPENLEDEYYAYRVRELLRKTLASLRRALELPETFISNKTWGNVVYERVASVAMKNYKDLFRYNDAERFQLFLGDVKSGKKKIAAGALLPHEIIQHAGDGVAELQWARTVSDLRALGKLNNCLAVCDVSGSMSGLPMDVCVALGLLLAEICEEPWHNRVITFSARPELHHVTGDTLWEKVHFIQRMHWMMNTDFQAVFDKLLSVAVACKLPPERMVKKVFVFSDMEFDQASTRPWETDYEAITRKFKEAGYGDAIPEIVFWNLRNSRSVPVTADQKGVALVSGFSKNMIKLFLEGDKLEFVPDKVPTPRDVMDQAISGPDYEKLAVFD